MSYVRHYYHLVFTPKERKPLLRKEVKRAVYNLIYRQILKLKGFVYRINGTEDHVHILVSIPSKIAVSEAVRIIKQEVSKNIVNMRLIPEWEKWQEGYSSFTCSYRELDMIKKYIMNQEEHHKKVSFIDEYRQWLKDNGISEDEPYFPKK